MHFTTLLPLLPGLAQAYPWAQNLASGRDLESVKDQFSESLTRRAATCPTHVTRQGAAPYSSYYPSKYTGARNGLPGNGKGGVLVPAQGDDAHAYVAPGPNDIRGPCPALNVLANHNFLSHDGQTTYTEMVDAAQNVFNWAYDLASFVATFGIIQTGDPLTEALSIGCAPGLADHNTGLDTHNKFEVDMSMSRTDYFLSPTGDAFGVNGTLFGEMVNYCGSQAFSGECMAAYSQKRFNESVATNGNFFNGFITFFVYGTSLLPYNSFASYASGSPNPTVSDIATFWGATQRQDGDWYYSHNESIPSNWYNRPDEYHLLTIIGQIAAQYLEYMSPLGGNTGKPNTFVGLNYPGLVENGTLQNATPDGIACLLYQVLTIGLPTNLVQTLQVSSAQSAYAKKKLSGTFAGFGCPSN